MDIAAARTFLEIVKAGSFVRAAAALNLTQTAISARVGCSSASSVHAVLR